MTTAIARSDPGLARRASAPLLAGLLLWAAAVALLPAPIAARILLLAPLVIVPRLIGLLPPRRWIGRLAGWPSLLAATPLLVAFSLPTGPLAAVFTLPWLAVALAGSAAGIRHGLSQLPSILHPRDLPALGIDVALAFWGVAATFTVVDRLGIETGFSPAILLLTATHFHFAGFGLLTLASLLAASHRRLRTTVLGLAVGIPVTALGFVLHSDVINAVGATIVGLAGIGFGMALVAGWPPSQFGRPGRVAGVALLAGMPMGIAWSLAILAGWSFLDLDTMVRTHGILNSTAVLLGAASYRLDVA